MNQEPEKGEIYHVIEGIKRNILQIHLGLGVLSLISSTLLTIEEKNINYICSGSIIFSVLVLMGIIARRGFNSMEEK